MAPQYAYKYQQLGTHLKANRKLQGIIGAGFIFLLFAGIWAWTPRHYHTSEGKAASPSVSEFAVGKGWKGGRPAYTFADGTTYEKPPEIKVHALVFYGRWDRVQVLECYLRKNLVKNGGFLDKVVFVSNTADEHDLVAFEKILKSEPEAYVRGHEMKPTKDKLDFHTAWQGVEPDVLYVKIDDDILFIHDDAIPQLVQYRISHPEYFMISANVINNPELSWVHTRLGAVHPFLPETTPPKGFNPVAHIADWKISKLPRITSSTDSEEAYKTPTYPHRWLPADVNMDFTPVSATEYNAFGPGWNDWRIAAQQHYSFFQNAEKGASGLAAYKFDTWDMNYERLSINMVTVWGKDVIKAFPIPRDDEAHLTQTVSRLTKRHVVVNGQALAAHYAYGVQKEGLAKTDVLQRYRAYAQEYCGKLLA